MTQLGYSPEADALADRQMPGVPRGGPTPSRSLVTFKNVFLREGSLSAVRASSTAYSVPSPDGVPGPAKGLRRNRAFAPSTIPSRVTDAQVAILQCPISQGALSRLSPGELIVVKMELEDGRRRHRDGTSSQVALAAGLATADRRFVYRIENDILWLLPALSLVIGDQVEAGGFAREKSVVQSFYDDFGWVKNASGKYNDTTEFTDTRTLTAAYQVECNRRIGRLLPQGKFLVDVASGAIPHPEYLDLSAGFETRVCIDFSIRALEEARAKLGERGMFILGDITCLPLRPDSVDAVISLHTIYHVPQPEQTTAVDEVVRVTKSGGRVVIAYVWGTSAAMNLAFGVRGFLGRIRHKIRPPAVPAGAPPASSERPALYFHPQNYDWYVREIAPRYHVRLRVWSSVSRVFLERFVDNAVGGRLVLGTIRFIENTFPFLAGRFGQLLRSKGFCWLASRQDVVHVT